MKNHKIITLLIIIVACILFIAFNYGPALKENIDKNSIVDQTTTRYFGNEAKGDIDGDGVEDRAFIITEDNGGSGTFYYVTVALKTPTKEVFAGKVLLGDRIAPQTTSIQDGIITVNYADRGPSDSFVVAPSIGKSLRVAYNKETGQISEVNASSSTPTVSTSPNTTSKPDITKLKITDHPWTWTKTVYNNDTTITPRAKDAFIITFMQDGRFSAKTDCNGVGGEYLVTENKIVLEKMMSTLMYCDQSQESEFTKTLAEVDNFFFSQDGELVLGLKFDSGSMIFR
jgi:heat shock protein HslJ